MLHAGSGDPAACGIRSYCCMRDPVILLNAAAFILLMPSLHPPDAGTIDPPDAGTIAPPECPTPASA